MKNESAGFLGASYQPCQRFPVKYMRDIVSYPFLSGFIDSLTCVFNMASPIAFRLGLKNAGRLASFLSLTPKVCLKHAVVMTFQIFLKYFMDKSRLLFAERSQKVALYVLQGKTGILACKRYGSTALSYEQVRDDTVDKMLCLRVYFIKYVFTTHLALFLNYITSTYIICW